MPFTSTSWMPRSRCTDGIDRWLTSVRRGDAPLVSACQPIFGESTALLPFAQRTCSSVRSLLPRSSAVVCGSGASVTFPPDVAVVTTPRSEP